MSDNLIIFARIPKTAGSTMKRILWQNYPTESLYHYISDRPWQPMFDQINRDQNIQCMQGHFGFGIHQHFQRSCSYITVLRHPLERTISYYYHVDKHLPYYASLTSRTLPSSPLPWDWFCRNLAHNLMTRYLSGYEWQYSSKCESMVHFELDKLINSPAIESYLNVDSAAMLAKAKQNIDAHFALVGLTERFDETLLLMKHILGWQKHLYVKHNVSNNRLPKPQCSPEIIDCIRAYNQWDIELYNYAQNLFDQQIKKIKNYHLELSYLKSNNWLFKTKQKIKKTFASN